MARRKALVLVVEVERAKDWEMPDDGRRVFTGEERIVIAELPGSSPPNLPPWLTTKPPARISSRPQPPPGSTRQHGGMNSAAFWMTDSGGPSPEA
jgi:hypothetical protein